MSVGQMKDKKSIVLEPTLDACVETQARHRYNHLLSRVLAGGEAPGVTGELECLKEFLQTADFSALRHVSEKHLLEGAPVAFHIRRQRGKLVCEMRVTGKGVKP